MYCEFFGLREPPFRESPDPRLLFASARFTAAADLLEKALGRGPGVLILVGPAGVGKTLLLRYLIDRATDGGARFLPLAHPDLALHEVADALVRGLGGEPLVGDWRAALGDALAAAPDVARGVVLVIDEAQAMPIETLAALPALLEVGRAGGRPFHILLAGQPALLPRLDEAHLPHDARAQAELTPLETDGVGEYLRARMWAAGAEGPSPFSPAAVRRIAQYSRGVPRMVNVLADGCLLAAYREQVREIPGDMVKRFWASYLRTGEAAWPPVPADDFTLKPPTAAAPPPAAPHRDPSPAASRSSTRRATRAAATPRTGMLPPPTRHIPVRERRQPILRGLVFALGILLLVAASASIAWRLYPTLFTDAIRGVSPTLPAWLATATVNTLPDAAGQQGPSPAEALGILEEFRQACEARDTARLRKTLADSVAGPDGHTLSADTVVAGFSPVFANLLTLVMVQPTTRIRTLGARTLVEAAFDVRTRDLGGLPGWSFGVARFEVGRRDGAVRITGLDLEPNDLLTPRVPALPAT